VLRPEKNFKPLEPQDFFMPRGDRPGTVLRPKSPPSMGAGSAAGGQRRDGEARAGDALAHVPEKWEPVFRIEHAQNQRI
jgi:hypothetical protein